MKLIKSASEDSTKIITIIPNDMDDRNRLLLGILKKRPDLIDKMILDNIYIDLEHPGLIMLLIKEKIIDPNALVDAYYDTDEFDNPIYKGNHVSSYMCCRFERFNNCVRLGMKYYKETFSDLLKDIPLWSDGYDGYDGLGTIEYRYFTESLAYEKHVEEVSCFLYWNINLLHEMKSDEFKKNCLTFLEKEKHKTLKILESFAYTYRYLTSYFKLCYMFSKK